MVMYNPFKLGISNRLDEIRAVFVEYYGESYRAIIEQSFRELIINEYTTPYGSDAILRNYMDLPDDEIIRHERERQQIWRNERIDINPYHFVGQFANQDKLFLLPMECEESGHRCEPNALVDGNGNFETKNIICIDMYNPPVWFDYIIVHELNHGIESGVVPLNKDFTRVKTICGFSQTELQYDPAKDDFVSESTTPQRKQIYNLNEVINEMLSRDITQLLHARGVFLYNDGEHIEEYTKVHKFYTDRVPKTQDFYTQNRDVIIESRLKKNLSILTDAIGKDRFLKQAEYTL